MSESNVSIAANCSTQTSDSGIVQGLDERWVNGAGDNPISTYSTSKVVKWIDSCQKAKPELPVPDPNILHDGASGSGDVSDPSHLTNGNSIPDLPDNSSEGQSEQSSMTNTSQITDQETPQERHSRRMRKRSHPSDETIKCPICSAQLRPRELANHLWVETMKLDKLPKYGKGCKGGVGKKSTGNGAHDDEQPSTSNLNVSQEDLYNTFLKVKSSREERQKRRGGRAQEVTCPVCNKRVTGTQDEISQHVDKCLRRDAEEEASVDIEDDEEFEEYEWAGQTRIRPTSLLQGGLAAAGFQVAQKSTEDEDEDLVVDDDDDSADNFGDTQYTEADVIPCVPKEEGKETNALRKAFMRGEQIKQQPVPEDRTRWEKEREDLPAASSSKECQQSSGSASSQGIINSLKSKIRDLEGQLNKHDLPKCLICMEHYVQPLVSTQCWHVHCEECWLRTLGAKKLCPQCNTITSPRDLRKLYL